MCFLNLISTYFYYMLKYIWVNVYKIIFRITGFPGLQPLSLIRKSMEHILDTENLTHLNTLQFHYLYKCFR
jgi:hypothetical protein